MKRNWTVIKAVSVVVYAVMLLPLLVVIVNSFNPRTISSFPPESLSLRWYREFFADDMLKDALWNSVKIGVASALGAGIVGTLTAMGFVRKRFRFKSGLVILLLAPLLVPPIIIGVSASIFFGELGVPRNIWWVITMHILIGLPYAFLIIRSQLYLFDTSLEEAALTLGASRLRTFREVTFPILSPTIMTAMVIVFVISFGEFTATQFWISRTTRTVPVVIFSMLRTGFTPEVDVVATLVLVITIVLPVLGVLLRRRFAFKQ